MRKLTIITVFLFGISLTAQRHEGKRNGMQDLTPQQVATLQTKKMTLALDLDETQQKEVASLLSEKAALRKTKLEERSIKRSEETRPTKEERFAMQNEHLDQQIAHKAEMKKILTEKQFTRWEKMQQRNREGKKRGYKKGHRMK